MRPARYQAIAAETLYILQMTRVYFQDPQALSRYGIMRQLIPKIA